MNLIQAEEPRGEERVEVADNNEEVLELSLDELSYVAGGFHIYIKY